MSETYTHCPRCQFPIAGGLSHCTNCGNVLASVGEKTLLINTIQRNGKSPWAKIGSFLKNGQPPFSETPASSAPVPPVRRTIPNISFTLPSARTNNRSDLESSEYSGDRTVIVGRELGLASHLVGWLVGTGGREAEQDFRLLIGKNTIGRGAEAMVRLSDAAVSHRHAVLWCKEGGEATLVDQDSQNGLLVNGNRIFQPTLLEHGDVIQFGGETRVQFVRFIRA